MKTIPIPEAEITTRDQAIDFANNLVAHFFVEGAKPIHIKYSFAKIRSNDQNAWYWKWLTDYVVPFFTKNPFKLVDFIMKKVLKMDITPEFMHTLYKIVYNGGNSTTKFDTKKMIEFCDNIRADLYHDYQLDIPEPTPQGESNAESKNESTEQKA